MSYDPNNLYRVERQTSGPTDPLDDPRMNGIIWNYLHDLDDDMPDAWPSWEARDGSADNGPVLMIGPYDFVSRPCQSMGGSLVQVRPLRLDRRRAG